MGKTFMKKMKTKNDTSHWSTFLPRRMVKITCARFTRFCFRNFFCSFAILFSSTCEIEDIKISKTEVLDVFSQTSRKTPILWVKLIQRSLSLRIWRIFPIFAEAFRLDAILSLINFVSLNNIISPTVFPEALCQGILKIEQVLAISRTFFDSRFFDAFSYDFLPFCDCVRIWNFVRPLKNF